MKKYILLVKLLIITVLFGGGKSGPLFAER